MRFATREVLSLAFLAACGAIFAYSAFAADPPQPVPVEKSMHEFMEYVFMPAYKRLKPLMAAAPADNTGWKGIKGESMVLAEGGNLLLGRLPEKDAAAWAELSVAVRDAGGQLYAAAKKKDFPAAKTHYEAMLKKCNACHQQFDNGKHQLMP